MNLPKTAHDAEELSARQHKALASLLSSSTVKDAALDASVSVRTIHGWLKEPAFAEAYRQAAVQHATARLQHVAQHAVAVLVTVMADKTSPPACRIAAARSVLEFAYKATEQESLIARIEALEQHA